MSDVGEKNSHNRHVIYCPLSTMSTSESRADFSVAELILLTDNVKAFTNVL